MTGQNEKRCSSQATAPARAYEGSHDHQCPDAVNRCGRVLVHAKSLETCGNELDLNLTQGFASIKASKSRLKASGSMAMDHDNHKEILIG